MKTTSRLILAIRVQKVISHIRKGVVLTKPEEQKADITRAFSWCLESSASLGVSCLEECGCVCILLRLAPGASKKCYWLLVWIVCGCFCAEHLETCPGGSRRGHASTACVGDFGHWKWRAPNCYPLRMPNALIMARRGVRISVCQLWALSKP